MAQRLPTVGSDDGTWGTLLNDFIGKEHDDITPGSTHANSGRHKTVTIKAGGSAAGSAPLKFDSSSSTKLGTPEQGAMEYDGTSFYLTPASSQKVILYADLSNVSGTLGIANGGTGQTSQTNAFDALAPTTTQGDIIYYNGTDNVRLAKGTAFQALTMNSGATAPQWSTVSYPTDYTQAFLLGGM